MLSVYIWANNKEYLASLTCKQQAHNVGELNVGAEVIWILNRELCLDELAKKKKCAGKRSRNYTGSNHGLAVGVTTHLLW